jgi:hypothetical protein
MKRQRKSPDLAATKRSDRPFVDTFIVPKLRTSVQDVLDNALKGRGTSNYELEVRTKSSEIRFLLVNATTRRDAET